MIYRVGLILVLLIPGLASAQTVSGISGTFEHGNSVEILGSGFGTKPSAAPVAWDNLEDGSCNTSATIGSWQSVHDLIVSTENDRHANSSYCATHNFNGEAWANFTGGYDSPKWYAQYWFYLDDEFDFGSSGQHLSNIKILRLWSTSSALNNTHVQLESRYDSTLRTEYVQSGGDWSPVVAGFDWVDQIFGHPDPGYVDGGCLGWRNYETDISTGSWHLFQFQYESSSVDMADGTLKWWYDGKLIFDHDDLETQDSDSGNSSYPRIHTLGFYNANAGASSADGDDQFFIDDAYIDNSWARVELGNHPDYNTCTQREIQPPSAWDPDAITVTANTGSFGAAEDLYVFVVDGDGQVSDGFLISEGAELPGQPGQPVRTD